MLAFVAPDPRAFGACLAIAFVSDILDGVVARRLDIATAGLRRLDGVADSLFYAAALVAAWHLYPDVIAAHGVALAVLLALEALRYALDLAKFRREASCHMWSSKLWGITLFVAFFALLALKHDGPVVALPIYVGVVADLEGLAISLLLERWTADVPSLVHLWRLRRDAAG